MRISVIVCFMCVSFFSVSAQKRDNVLANTRWKYAGLLYNSDGTLHPCPINSFYTIYFQSHNKLSGVATVRYNGRYRIKKNGILKIRAFISKGVSAGLNEVGEFDCRLDYRDYLSRDSRFVIEGDELRILSGQYVTMVFKAIK